MMTAICATQLRYRLQIATLFAAVASALVPLEVLAAAPSFEVEHGTQVSAAQVSAAQVGSAQISGAQVSNTQTIAEPSVQARGRSRPRSNRPLPPPSPPPNRVQPGGGLDEFAQACDYEQPSLTALIPYQNPVYTALDRPTLLFHLPDRPADIDKVEFILLSADEKDKLYVAEFVPTRAGIVSIALPAGVPALEPGKVYRWYLNVYCQTITAIPSVDGWVHRVSTDPASEDLLPPNAPASQAQSPERLADVGTSDVETGTELPEIWYDAIAQTADLLASSDRAESPLVSQAEANWQSWLEAIGLGELIHVPFVGPVMPRLMTDGAEN
ncbi:MAG: DUF928 domain-containing protein [Phormidesmis sp.]